MFINQLVCQPAINSLLETQFVAWVYYDHQGNPHHGKSRGFGRPHSEQVYIDAQKFGFDLHKDDISWI